MIISPSRFRASSSSMRMIVKSYGPEGAPIVIVKECTGHTCHPQQHVLWYLFHQPTTTVSLKVTYKFDIYKKKYKKKCFSRSREEVQSSRSICRRAPTISEYGHQPNSPARLSSLQSEGAQHHCVTLYTYRYTVTTKMTSALSWAAMRAILMFHNC